MKTIVGFLSRPHGFDALSALIKSQNYKIIKVYTHKLNPKSQDPQRTVPLVPGIKRAMTPSTPEGRPDDHRFRVNSPLLEPGKRNADLMSPVGGDTKRQELQEAMEAGDPVPMSPDSGSRPHPPVDTEANANREDGMEFQSQTMETEPSDEDL